MSTNKKDDTVKSNLEKEALEYHKKGRPGKLEITPTTPLISSHDLSLASVSYTHLRAHET